MDTYENAIHSWDETYQECLEWKSLEWSIEFINLGGLPALNEKVWAKVYRSQCDKCQNPKCEFRTE